MQALIFCLTALFQVQLSIILSTAAYEKVIELLLCRCFNSNYFQLLLCSIAFFVSPPTSFLPPKVWISSHSIHKYSDVMLTDV